ncbi:MAG: hypothetical protein RLY61_469 [Candidatus Parcubacteria bacterium]|jgi:crossover junction endodeoxyribonuclease RuvC
MIYLGIDPGTATTGFAIVELKTASPVLHEAGVILTKPDVLMHDRLSLLFDSLKDITKKYSPKTMVIEKLFFNTNTKTAMTVGQARGVALLVASQGKMTVCEYTALEAKKAITGYGRADKKEMQKAVMDFMELDHYVKVDDANDAVAMVICHLKKTNLL